MKKLWIFLILGILILSGCAASTYTSRSAAGVTLTFKNYIVTEITSYDADGKITQVQKTMIPDKSIIEGAIEKILGAVKSLISVVKGPVDAAAKTIIPEAGGNKSR